MHLPREFQLVAACCRWPPSPAGKELIVALAADIDWALVVRVAERHRVEGLVWRALREIGVAVPGAAGDRLQAAAAQIAWQNIALAAESLRLSQRLGRAGIHHLFVKGVSLAALIYGAINTKKGWDIDLLVPLASVEAVAALLEEDGFRLTIPNGPRARERLGLWHELWKESEWTRTDPDRELYVELHTRLSDNPMLLPNVGLDSDLQHVEVSKGLSLPTLGNDELFAYLCVHGASSAWFRLKWIADVGALIGRCDPAEITRLYRRSQELGAGRSAAQALLLCRRLFETQLPPELASELTASRMNRWLTAIALRKLSGRAFATELEDIPLGTATMHLMQLGLLPGFRFKFAEIGRQLVNPADRLAAPLPPALRFLYPLLAIRRRLIGP